MFFAFDWGSTESKFHQSKYRGGLVCTIIFFSYFRIFLFHYQIFKSHFFVINFSSSATILACVKNIANSKISSVLYFWFDWSPISTLRLGHATKYWIPNMPKNNATKHTMAFKCWPIVHTILRNIPDTFAQLLAAFLISYIFRSYPFHLLVQFWLLNDSAEFLVNKNGNLLWDI